MFPKAGICPLNFEILWNIRKVGDGAFKKNFVFKLSIEQTLVIVMDVVAD